MVNLACNGWLSNNPNIIDNVIKAALGNYETIHCLENFASGLRKTKWKNLIFRSFSTETQYVGM